MASVTPRKHVAGHGKPWDAGDYLGVAFGGTGLTTIAAGALLYASGLDTLSALASGANGYVLTSNGVGVAPSWQPIAVSTDDFLVWAWD